MEYIKTKKRRKKPTPKSKRQREGRLYKNFKNIDTNEYVDNEQFYNAMVDSINKKELTPLAIDCYVLLANKAIKSFHYSDIKDKEDCLSIAYEDFVKFALKNFNPDRTNAVAYFSTMAFNGFMKGWNTLKKKSSKDTKYIVFVSEEPYFSTYDKVLAENYCETLMDMYSKENAMVTIKSFTVNKNISMDKALEEDGKGGIYNI